MELLQFVFQREIRSIRSDKHNIHRKYKVRHVFLLRRNITSDTTNNTRPRRDYVSARMQILTANINNIDQYCGIMKYSMGRLYASTPYERLKHCFNATNCACAKWNFEAFSMLSLFVRWLTDDRFELVGAFRNRQCIQITTREEI